METCEGGGWGKWRPVEVFVPATLGLDGRVWYGIRQGLRGLLVRDEAGLLRVYPLVEPSSHYYRTMTRADWMPCLVQERI